MKEVYDVGDIEKTKEILKRLKIDTETMITTEGIDYEKDIKEKNSNLYTYSNSLTKILNECEKAIENINIGMMRELKLVLGWYLREAEDWKQFNEEKSIYPKRVNAKRAQIKEINNYLDIFKKFIKNEGQEKTISLVNEADNNKVDTKPEETEIKELIIIHDTLSDGGILGDAIKKYENNKIKSLTEKLE